MREIVGRRLDLAFEFAGFLKGLSHISRLNMFGDFLLEHLVDHKQLDAGLLHGFLDGFVLVKRALQARVRRGSGGRLDRLRRLRRL